jgi:hypothetical protein
VHRPEGRDDRGTSLVELLVTAAIVMAAGAIAAPALGGRASDIAASGAARYVGALMQRGRFEAIRRSTSVAYRFEPVAGTIRYALFADGNGNGVRTADIGRGVDSQVSTWESLSDHFSGVNFAIAPGVTDIDSGSPLSGDPLRIGGSDLLSFNPTGNATSGTLYLMGRDRQQYAVRVLGATARTRVLRFLPEARQWVQP